MRTTLCSAALFAVFSMTTGSSAMANDDVTKLQADPNNWASQSGDYSATRYSTLDQINTSNVGQLKVAWTFSTGVLRGHEGSPWSSAMSCIFTRRFRTSFSPWT